MVVFLFGQCFGLSVGLSIIGLVVQGFSRLWERFFLIRGTSLHVVYLYLGV